MVDPEKKYFLSSSSIIAQNLAAVSHTVCRRSPLQKIGGTLAPRTFWWGVADPLEIRHSTNAVMADLVVLSEIILSG